VAWPFEDDWYNATISAGLLVSGTNVLAVEIHQDDASSSDISFNLKLTGNTAPLNALVVRGPYLQNANNSQVVIKWRTNVNSDAKVRYGVSPVLLNQTAYASNFGTEHEVLITGLSTNTVYYYEIGDNTSYYTPSTTQYFKTLPVQGTEGAYQFWVIGDAGTGNNNQRAVRDAMLNYTGNTHLDGWIMLGDNAYDGGFDSEYQVGVFGNMYESILTRTVLWPTPGNHDYNNHIPFSPDPAYYDIFTLPAAGQAGGIPSGTEKYYSWNFGNIHFISLDSYDEDRGSNAAMANWLQADLAANTQPWVIAYWHHPPYTKGSHDSDNPLLYDFELPEIRQNIIPILEQFGVDLVLNGHSHCYERSFLIDGHYGNSDDLQPSMILDQTTGSYPTVCPYEKHDEVVRAHKGTVYAVVGCSGKLSGTSSGWPHPIMSMASNALLGSMLITIEGNKLEAKFIGADSSIHDSFTIMKNVGKRRTISACPGDVVYLNPSWPGEAEWFPGNQVLDSLPLTVNFNTTVFAYDPAGCIQDTFDIQVLPSPPCANANAVQELERELKFRLQPSLSNGVIPVWLSLDSETTMQREVVVTDIRGAVVYSTMWEIQSGPNALKIPCQHWEEGMYFVSIPDGNKNYAFRFVIVH
jgi:hypothetical protein